MAKRIKKYLRTEKLRKAQVAHEARMKFIFAILAFSLGRTVVKRAGAGGDLKKEKFITSRSKTLIVLFRQRKEQQLQL